MPPKKNLVNGFWLFAQSNKGKWKAQGLVVATNEQLIAIASPLWKSMSPEEKKQWETRAKEERKQKKMENPDLGRLDNTGQVIALRRDPVEEARIRREREIAETTSHWHEKDLTEEKFYFINFQDLCEVTEGDNERKQWLPREMAIVQYCLKEGITETYHQFIWPGRIPLGFRLKAENKSEEYHKIPVEETERDSQNYMEIFSDAKRLLSKSLQGDRYPPLYCLVKGYEKTKFLCDWLWLQSGGMMNLPNPLGKVHSLEDLVHQLLAFSGKPNTQNVAKFQILEQLQGSQWDYISSTACEFHKELDVSRYCSLAIVRKLAFTVSDMLAMHYDIELSERHVPVKEEPKLPSIRSIPPNWAAITNAGRRRFGGYRSSSSPSSNVKRTGGGRTYAELSQPLSGRDSEDSEQEVEAFASPSKSELPWGRTFVSPPRAVVASGDSFTAPRESLSPVAGQFADRPERGGKQGISEREVMEGGDHPALQMSGMRVSDEPPAWIGGRGRGAAFMATPAANAPPVQHPPGFTGVNVPRGRGFIPGQASDRPTLPGGRGSMPSLPFSTDQDSAFGRGVSIGRGAMPPDVTQRPCVGRGRMPVAGRGVMPGYNKTPQSVTGAPRSVGRGCMPGHGAVQTPPLGVQELECELPQSEREGGRDFVGGDASQPVLSSSDVSNIGLDTDSDNFQPSLLEEDFPSLQSAGRGFGGARGVNSDGARMRTVGRGSMAMWGRGYMPSKKGSEQGSL